MKVRGKKCKLVNMVILNTQSWFLLLHNVPSGQLVNKLCNTMKILMEQNAKMIGTEQNQTISEHLLAWFDLFHIVKI